MNARTSCRLCATAGLLLAAAVAAGLCSDADRVRVWPGHSVRWHGRDMDLGRLSQMGLRYEKVLSAEHDALVRQLIGEELAARATSS